MADNRENQVFQKKTLSNLLSLKGVSSVLKKLVENLNVHVILNIIRNKKNARVSNCCFYT